MRSLKKTVSYAFVITLMIFGPVYLVGHLVTQSWSYKDDGLCDVSGVPAKYVVFKYNETEKEIHEFSYPYAFLYAFFNVHEFNKNNLLSVLPESLVALGAFLCITFIGSLGFVVYLEREKTVEARYRKEQMNVCPSCGFENPSYAEKFCIKCGSSLRKPNH